MKKTYAIILIIILMIALSPFSFWAGKYVAEKIYSSFKPSGKKVSLDISGNSNSEIVEEEPRPAEDIAPAMETENSALTDQNQQPAENPVAPAENNPENINSKFSFAIIGDTQGFNSGNPNGSFQKAVKEISKQNPDIVFALGDLVSSCDGGSSCEGKYNNWKNSMGSLFSKAYEMQGNHDRTGKEKADKVWEKIFNLPTNGPEGFKKFAYSLDFGNSHFVVLDSDKPKEFMINATQLAWLEQDLARNKKENIFVFFHEPAYPVSNKIGEGLDTNSKERNNLWDILVRHKVTAVFSGHEHIISRKKTNGLYQFVFGNTDTFLHDLPKPGMAEYSVRTQGFGIVEVDGKNITVKTYAVTGNLLNSIAFSK